MENLGFAHIMRDIDRIDRIARLDARLPGVWRVAGLILKSGNILSLRLIMKSFQVGQLSLLAKRYALSTSRVLIRSLKIEIKMLSSRRSWSFP